MIRNPQRADGNRTICTSSHAQLPRLPATCSSSAVLTAFPKAPLPSEKATLVRLDIQENLCSSKSLADLGFEFEKHSAGSFGGKQASCTSPGTSATALKRRHHPPVTSTRSGIGNCCCEVRLARVAEISGRS